ncbi:MAG: protein-glutamate O-methyltransferase CheR [Gemmatimonadetes bacterium]|nr:protein-glutamate O-methyltransferase CheR [Gemmatimonadota bacterium]
MISGADYQALREILLANSGHHLGEGKEYLVERRLEAVAGSLGFPDLAALVRHMRLTRDPKVVKLACEAMTTNESLFFRDGRPFELMKERILPDLMARKRASRRLRIWSAACSTGQEAYSLAILVAEYPALAGWTVEILGTDYSPKVVERAREGVFNHFEAQRGLSIQLLIKHFEQQEGNSWRVKDSLRRNLTFLEGNLLEPFRHLGSFDIVFCRNVLIYFDDVRKKSVLDRLEQVVAPDGYLILGASETVLGISSHWQVVPGAGTTLFQKSSAVAQARSIA